MRKFLNSFLTSFLEPGLAFGLLGVGLAVIATVAPEPLQQMSLDIILQQLDSRLIMFVLTVALGLGGLTTFLFGPIMTSSNQLKKWTHRSFVLAPIKLLTNITAPIFWMFSGILIVIAFTIGLWQSFMVGAFLVVLLAIHFTGMFLVISSTEQAVRKWEAKSLVGRFIGLLWLVGAIFNFFHFFTSSGEG